MKKQLIIVFLANLLCTVHTGATNARLQAVQKIVKPTSDFFTTVRQYSTTPLLRLLRAHPKKTTFLATGFGIAVFYVSLVCYKKFFTTSSQSHKNQQNSDLQKKSPLELKEANLILTTWMESIQKLSLDKADLEKLFITLDAQCKKESPLSLHVLHFTTESMTVKEYVQQVCYHDNGTKDKDRDAMANALKTLALGLQLLNNPVDNKIIDEQKKSILDNSSISAPWILKNYPKALLKKPTILNSQKIYQFIVLEQGTNECFLHAARNLFYIMDILQSGRDEFNTIYTTMTNQESYETYANNIGCPRNQPGSFELEKIIEKNKKILPKNSEKYAQDIFEFEWLENKKSLEEEWVKSLTEFIKLQEKQTEEISQSFAEDVVTTRSFDGTYKHLVDLLKQEHAIIGFSVDVYTVMEHNVSFAVHINGEKHEYFFADSFNQPLANKSNYQSTVKKIINFIETPDYLRDSLLRYKVWHLSAYRGFDQKFIGKIKAKPTLAFIQKILPQELLSGDLYKKIYQPYLQQFFKEHKDYFASEEEYKNVLNYSA